MIGSFDFDATFAKLVEVSDGFPQYAYGMLQAAVLGERLGHEEIAVLELGVAGGNGLVSMERLAARIEEELDIRIWIAGVDLGLGMPEPADYRDMPYVWQQGFFRIDEERLRNTLTRAELLLGDVADVGPTVLHQCREHSRKIGFISFDLDYYSATKVAIAKLLNDVSTRYLPRVSLYFDDTVGPHEEIHSRLTGELLAIDEHNDVEPSRQILEVNGLRYKLGRFDDSWVSGFRVMHVPEHLDYNTYVYPDQDRQFPLNMEGATP